ncbi:peroxide stress protein YaaA [Paracoccaceae bacterium Fryx2]|nr:peroxide stress protein YaaA [Paracoccaceae bacterium Fryx2]
MLTVISPAKRLDEAPLAGAEITRPAFGAEALELAAVARGLTVADLRRLMGISEPLARLNRDRFAGFAAQAEKPAMRLFAGDTYAGLEARTLDTDALRWAQGRLRILSGLYGLLRPLDAIRPHRLEMGSRLANPRGPDLYAFWGDRIARALDAQADAVGARVLVNCASAEYFGAVDRAALRLRVVTPVFLEDREGEPRIVSFWAKKARGAMARFIAEHRLTDPADLRDFAAGGYRYDAALSDGDRPVFLRPALVQTA